MTNPLNPGGQDNKRENIKDKEEKQESSSLSLSDLVSSQDAKQNTTAPGNFGKPTFANQAGRNIPFQLKQTDYLHNKIEKPLAELKPLVDNFLKDTASRKEHKLSISEQKELEQTRESLAKFTNADDAMYTAMTLAKFYQDLHCIEEAKKAVDLSLGIDPNNHAVRELFKELEHMHPPDIAASPVSAKTISLSKSNLRQRINKLATGRVMVLGDLLIDELLEGKPERISREAPVLILEHVLTEYILGGAGNTANNIAALGGKCHAIGICGEDEYASRLRELLDRSGISHILVPDKTRTTTVKTRILSKSHSFRQQILRLDRISHNEIGTQIENKVIESIEKIAGQYQAIVISDYLGGIITEATIAACKRAAIRHNLQIIVDAQNNFERFQNVTLMTPNQPDVEKAVGFSVESPESLKQAGETLLKQTDAKAILITRGDRGMALFEKGQAMVEIPVFNKSEVFDVTGAGDTVIATMSLALVSGSNFVEAMALGNLAAGVVVKKPGTAVVNQQELLAALEHVNLPE